MKILVLSSCYPTPQAPNYGIFVHQQVKALVAQGVDVHVIQPVGWYPPLGLHKWHPYWEKGYKQHKNTFDDFEGIKIYHPKISIPMPSRFFSEDGWGREGRQLAKYILKHSELKNADLVYAQFLIHEGYEGSIIKEKTGIPLVSIALGDDVHAWPEENPQYIPKLKEVLNKSDLVLANSLRLAKDTEKWLSEEEKINVKCVYQGIDLDKFKLVSNHSFRLGKKDCFDLINEKKYLLCVATPIALKGWLELLDSIEFLRDELLEWNLVMVAPPRKSPDTLNLIEEAKKRKIEDLVIYIGAVDPVDMPSLMQAVDAFILPSYNEGLSNAVLEAMASGLPVITTDVGGHSEVIEHGKNGYLMKPKSSEIITDALRKVLLDDRFRSELAKNAREGAQKIGSFEDNARILLNIFRKLVKNYN